MSKFKVNQITNKGGDRGPVIAGITTVNSTGAMRIPSGNTGMRIEYSSLKDNQIVKDGLILHLDLANPNCLSGGAEVRDLSGAGVYDTGTIIGDCLYSPDGGGSLQMGTGGRGGIEFPLLDTNGPLALDRSTQDAISVCSWVGGVDMTRSSNVIASTWYATNAAGWLLAINETAKDGNRPVPAVLVSDGADSSGAWSRPGWNGPNIPEYDQRALHYWQTTQSINAGVGNTTASVGKDIFNNVGQTLVRWQGVRNTAVDGWGIRTWINGLKNGMATPIFENSGYGYTNETGIWGRDNRNFNIGCTDNSGSTSYLKGKLAVIMIYNRELTHAEMQQNFNAQRYRFGRQL